MMKTNTGNVSTGKAKGKEKVEGKTTGKVVELVDKAKIDSNPVVKKIEDKKDAKIDGQAIIDDNGKVGKAKGKALKESENKKVLEPFARTTRLEKSSRNVSIKSLYKEWKKDEVLIIKRQKEIEEAILNGDPIPDTDIGTTLRFDLAIQRNEAWSDYQKSDLIHSVLYGYYIPPVLVQDSNDGKKWFLEGKQRITTLMRFINGEFALSKNAKDVCGFKIASCKFGDLPVEMKEEIFDESITIVSFKNMTEQERDTLFIKQNSGSPLSRIELTRAMHSELIKSINKIAEFKFFKSDIELSKKARTRFIDQEIILQIAMLLEEGKDIKGFGAKHIEEYVLRLKESEQTLSDEFVQRFELTSDYLSLALEDFDMIEIKRVLKKNHIPIIFWNAEKAMSKNLKPELFGQFVRSFLISGYSIESKYGASCQSSSSKKENVICRLNEMELSFDDFLQDIKEASSESEGVSKFDRNLADKNGIERQIESDEL